MNITEVKIKLMGSRSDRLRAFCSITIDNDFVIRDLRIIEGAKGTFVAMPSRKLTDKCPQCGTKNHLRGRFCNECGFRLNEDRAVSGPRARNKFHVDIAHPINSRCRQEIQEKVLRAYDEEVDQSKLPGYRPREDYDAEEYDIDEVDGFHPRRDEGQTQSQPPTSPPAGQEPKTDSDDEHKFGQGLL